MLQVMWNQGPTEHPEAMPNGYGMVRLPHLLGQPGRVMLLPVVAAGENGIQDRNKSRKTESILVVGEW